MHTTRSIKRLLVANRGEIAVRVIRAARELGIETVSVYSNPDAGSKHHRLADHSVSLDGSTARETYLNQEKLLLAITQSGADAVHPGYGFFAENADFAQAVGKLGAIFVGPKPETILRMGDKERARNEATAAGVPVVPGTEAGLTISQFRQFAAEIGYPVLVKAVAGGSGRGMRVVESESELEAKIAEAEKEAQAGFGNPRVLIEKYIAAPRHIEVQVFSDSFDTHCHVAERECSVQRRHQKLIEEAPAPNLDPKLRKKICESAVALCKKVGYLGAGTAEFIVPSGENREGNFYFLEMNTRIQVEHPVTEAATGIDLVKEQLQVASGKPLSFTQKQVACVAHAMEFRVYAEDPQTNFSPRTGAIEYISRVGGPGVREESWVESGSVLSPHYDALLSKIIISAPTRGEAIARARATLDEYVVDGIQTTLGFHRWLLRQPDFIDGKVDVNWIARTYRGEMSPPRLVSALPR